MSADERRAKPLVAIELPSGAIEVHAEDCPTAAIAIKRDDVERVYIAAGTSDRGVRLIVRETWVAGGREARLLDVMACADRLADGAR